MRHVQTRKTIWSLLPFLLLLVAVNLPGQYSISSTEAIGGSMDDFGESVDRNEDGFTLVGARSRSSDEWVSSNQGGTDFWIIQKNPDGDTLWSRTYGGFNSDDLHAIGYKDDVIAAFGTTRSDDGDVGNNPGVIGAWLLVTNLIGDPIISRVYAGTLGEQGIDMVVLNDGYALLVQSTSPELEGAINNGNFDYWLAETNSSGAVEWANFYGGSDADVPMRVKRVTGGGYIIAGYSNSTNGQVIGNKGGFDYWIVRTDNDGNLLWARTYGGSGDDMATDVIPLMDGSFIVIGESESTDGDRSESFGGSDIWVLKLSADGDILWEKSYGGSNTEHAARAEVFPDLSMVITGTSRSDDGLLTGNKGLTDAWVFFTDDEGNLEQQMNYGSTMDEEINDVHVSEDNIITIVGSSNSRSGNLPPVTPDMYNAWIFTMQEDTVPCTVNSECFVQDVSSGIINVGTNAGLICANSCNRGSDPGPVSSPGCHNFFGKPTTWLKVRTDSEAEQMTLSVFSDDFNEPQIAVVQSTDCQSLLRLDCTVGSDGFAQIINVDVEPDTAYYILVADDAGLAGEFRLCAQVTDRNFCNNSPSLYATSTSMGSPLNGPYLPGESVQICYEINEWDKLECNGIQGIQPSFGPGWDSTVFSNTGEPLQVDTMLVPFAAEGEWRWELLGEVNYNFTNPSQGYVGGQGLPPGWYFTNLGDPPPNDGPDDTTGDIISCLPDTNSFWKVCFTLRTISDCIQDLDCSVTVKSFADGEIGSNVNQACQFDEPITFAPILKCCINPLVSTIPNSTICSGDTVSRLFSSNLVSPVQYIWEVESSGNIVGAEPGTGPLLSQVVFNFGQEPEVITYSVVASKDGCVSPPREFTVVVRPVPTAQMSLLTDVVCAGEEALVRFTFNGTAPYRAQYSVDGVLGELFFFDEPTGTAPIVLEETSLVNFAFFRDAQCIGSTQGSFVINVEQNSVKDTLATICNADTFYVGDDKFFVSGTYQSTLENAASNGCDSIVNLQLFVRPRSGENLDLVICEGDTAFIGDNGYTETGSYSDTLINQVGCDSIVNLTLFVTTEILTEETALLCPGETYLFRGEVLTQSGTYRDTVPASDVCDSIFTLDLTILSTMFLSETVIEPDTGNSSGSIAIEVSGGLPPYDYLWSNGSTADSIVNVPTGEYTLTVTDFAGCEAEFNFFLTTSTRDPIPGVISLEVFPNPVGATEQVFIQFTSERGDLRELELSLLDIAGRVLYMHEHTVTAGRNTFAIPEGLLNGQMGLVVLREKDGAGVMTRKVVFE